MCNNINIIVNIYKIITSNINVYMQKIFYKENII